MKKRYLFISAVITLLYFVGFPALGWYLHVEHQDPSLILVCGLPALMVSIQNIGEHVVSEGKSDFNLNLGSLGFPIVLVLYFIA